MNLASVASETTAERPDGFNIYLLFDTCLGCLIMHQMMLERQWLPVAHTKKYVGMPPPSAMCAPDQVPPPWACPLPFMIPGYATAYFTCKDASDPFQ